eukprot:Nk52_evm68s745 gene=Nk52_evmTU68s745
MLLSSKYPVAVAVLLISVMAALQATTNGLTIPENQNVHNSYKYDQKSAAPEKDSWNVQIGFQTEDCSEGASTTIPVLITNFQLSINETQPFIPAKGCQKPIVTGLDVWLAPPETENANTTRYFSISRLPADLTKNLTTQSQFDAVCGRFKKCINSHMNENEDNFSCDEFDITSSPVNICGKGDSESSNSKDCLKHIRVEGSKDHWLSYSFRNDTAVPGEYRAGDTYMRCGECVGSVMGGFANLGWRYEEKADIDKVLPKDFYN